MSTHISQSRGQRLHIYIHLSIYTIVIVCTNSQAPSSSDLSHSFLDPSLRLPCGSSCGLGTAKSKQDPYRWLLMHGNYSNSSFCSFLYFKQCRTWSEGACKSHLVCGYTGWKFHHQFSKQVYSNKRVDINPWFSGNENYAYANRFTEGQPQQADFQGFE